MDSSMKRIPIPIEALPLPLFLFFSLLVCCARIAQSGWRKATAQKLLPRQKGRWGRVLTVLSLAAKPPPISRQPLKASASRSKHHVTALRISLIPRIILDTSLADILFSLEWGESNQDQTQRHVGSQARREEFRWGERSRVLGGT